MKHSLIGMHRKPQLKYCKDFKSFHNLTKLKTGHKRHRTPILALDASLFQVALKLTSRAEDYQGAICKAH